MSKSTTYQQKKPIVSLKEARKLLGKESKQLKDDDLEGMINQMVKIADKMIDRALVPNNEEV